MGILVPQPFPLSQTPPPDSDEVLRDFLQEMAELDRLNAPKTPEAKTRKREAIDTPPRPAKKAKRTETQPPDKFQLLETQIQTNTTMTRWQRRKLELETLKEQAETLANYVTFLQACRVPGMLLQGSIHLPPQLEQLVKLQTGGWQAAAIREIRRCQASQQENQELKEKIQACVQDSGRLQTALNTALTLRREQLGRNSVAARALKVEMMMDQHFWADDAHIFDMLERSVNARVSEIQAITREVSQPVVTANTEHVCICRKDEAHAAVEFKTMRVLPFDVETVSSVCWRVAEHGWKNRGARVVRRAQDVVSSDWCFPVQLDKGETVEIRVRSVAKRFKVQQGFVVIAESSTEWPAHLAASGAWSRVTRESGWGLVHSYPANGNGSDARDSSSSSPESVSKFVVHMTCVPSGLDSDTSRKLLGSPAVSDVVIPSFRTLIRNRQQCVDNRLMDAAFLHGNSSISAI
ncbi:hypothetical protein F441_13248 [Phytophthora nicotianae CJ01A1]|uniref:Uncharacterized protein n=2 Tax=Phytophthora nicotianae TaxID=4792 RepID=W2WNV6_PHYNI|nr:hypothetical protein L915_12994 [Phytophthora nicotianae]ETP11239.1 hypothetical protein F441_13248 [Phytophthora nicotianae CJ01A1]